MELLLLYAEFALIGLFAIGGGLATLPFLEDLGQRTGWFTPELLSDMFAVSEVTPGAIGLNMATYVGFNVSGILGGIVATLGLMTPSIIIILTIAHFLQKFKNNRFVKSTFVGLRPASTALIAVALVSIIQITFGLPELTEITSEALSAVLTWKNLVALLLAALIFILLKKTKLHPVIFIAISAVIGILLKL